jgi:hypothetical protein
MQEGISPGGTLTVGINLIAPALTRAPFLIHALKPAGRNTGAQTL